MHANYPVVVQHHPGWFGAFVGVMLGIMLTIGILIVTGVDLPTIFPSETAVTQTPAQMYEAHWAREHAADLDAAQAAALQVHFDREHAAEIAPIRYGR